MPSCADPRSRDTEAVLRGSVDDPNLWVRYHGIHSLARRARHGGALATWLPARLIERARSDAAPPVRIAAMEAIAALHVERGIPVLTAASGDPVPDIAAAAVLALSGSSLRINAESDQMLIAEDVPRFAAAYLAGTDARHPYASPLYADVHGLAPTLIQAGGDEILRDDAVRMAEKMRAAGCDVELQVWPAMPHTWQLLAPVLPEAREAIDEIARFFAQRLG